MPLLGQLLLLRQCNNKNSLAKLVWNRKRKKKNPFQDWIYLNFFFWLGIMAIVEHIDDFASHKTLNKYARKPTTTRPLMLLHSWSPHSVSPFYSQTHLIGFIFFCIISPVSTEPCMHPSEFYARSLWVRPSISSLLPPIPWFYWAQF